MIDNFDLLFYDRDPTGKIVVFPDFPGQLLDLCICDCLMLVVRNQDS